jgi:uncharacterized membrane protein
MPTSNERFLEIDLFRTIGLLMMFVYHIGFDLAFFYNYHLDPLSGGWLMLQRSTACLFLLVVGISFSISFGRMKQKGASRKELLRKYLLNGLGLIIIGELISLVTFFAVGDQYVRFGVLHLIGVSVILAPLLIQFRELNAFLAVIVFFIGRFVANLHTNSSLLLPLGITRPNFDSIDYYPLFPWLAAVLVGIALGNFLYNRGFLKVHLKRNRLTLSVTSPGRHSLIIYLIHQPIFLGILNVLALLKIL